MSSITAEFVDLPLAWGDWREGRWIFFKKKKKQFLLLSYRFDAGNHTIYVTLPKLSMNFNWPQINNAFRHVTETNANPF